MAWVRCCGGGSVPLINFPWNGLSDFNQTTNYGPLSAHSTGEIHTVNKAPKIGANLNLKYQSSGSGWYYMDIKIQWSTDGILWNDLWTGSVAEGTEYTINTNSIYGKEVYFRIYIVDSGAYNCYYTLNKFTIE